MQWELAVLFVLNIKTQGIVDGLKGKLVPWNLVDMEEFHFERLFAGGIFGGSKLCKVEHLYLVYVDD